MATACAAVAALERYPALAAELTEMLSLVQASNAEVEAANRTADRPWIQPAETVTRGPPENGIQWLVSGVRLPPCGA